jgi:hypothetical protein
VKSISWRGHVAEYSEAEQKIMNDLMERGDPATREREARFVHELKATFAATLLERKQRPRADRTAATREPFLSESVPADEKETDQIEMFNV